MKRIFLVAMILTLLVACNKKEEEVQTVTRFGTIENPNQLTNFYFNQDDSIRLWILNSDIKYYRPKDGQRAIIEYVILTNKARGSSYQHDVTVKDVYEVLTKNIFTISTATQDSIGNDPIAIRDMWIAGDYLNVDFIYPGYSKTHYINLVSDTLKNKSYTDDKIHLEFRHNANSDYPSYNISGIVSFNIKTIRKAGSNTVDLVVHTKEFDSVSADKTYNLAYKYNTAPSSAAPKQLNIPARKAVIR